MPPTSDFARLVSLAASFAVAACGGSGANSADAGSTGQAGAGGGAAGAAGGPAGTTGAAGSGASVSGCRRTGAPTGVMTDGQIQVAGSMRSFVLSVPSSYDSGVPYPLIFAWHGLGSNGTQARQYFRVEASGRDAIFVYPTALPNSDGDNAWDLGAEGVDVQLFDALVAQISATYCVDSLRIFATGHSYGGYFSNRLGCSRGNVLRAIAPVAGAPPRGGGGATQCAGGPLAAWIAHGMADPTVPFTNGEATLAFWTGANGCSSTSLPVEPSPCVAYQTCVAGAPVYWCAHPGMHEWPSFAGAAIWEFFSMT
jgi:poly(3-hydroxybutyrate) depolymerase